MEQDRQTLLAKIVALCDDYFLEHTTHQHWEEFDPDLDEIRSKAQDAMTPLTMANLEACADGMHSWVASKAKHAPDYPCAFCGERYGDPD